MEGYEFGKGFFIPIVNMIRTKSFKEYKRLKSKVFKVELVTKADLN